jgi:DNA-binding XRE family transcriptional regulator
LWIISEIDRKRVHLMKRSSYREQDYPFGQLMLTLRARIGLTQAGLADLLHVSRRAVAEWEAGLAYPKTEHLKAFIALCLRQQAFAAGREAQEVCALWHAAHQHVLLDEPWLRGCWRSCLPHG